MSYLRVTAILTVIVTAAFGEIYAATRSRQSGLQRRRECPAVPDTTPLDQLCSASCGEGYTQCTDYYTCFNPGLGQICCDDGSKPINLLPAAEVQHTDTLRRSLRRWSLLRTT